MNAVDTHPTMGTPEELYRERHQASIRAYGALGLLMQETPITARIAEWSVRGDSIEVMHGSFGLTDDEKRRSMRRIANALGFTYDEQPNSDTSAKNKIAVFGVFDGVNVDFWVLVDRCACGCHHATVTE